MDLHTNSWGRAVTIVTDDETGNSDIGTIPCEASIILLTPKAEISWRQTTVRLTCSQANNLWQRAFQTLSPDSRRCLKFVQDGSVEPPTPEKLISLINEKKNSCEEKQWVIFTNKEGEKVKLRTVMEKICARTAEFQKIGDASVGYVPHAAIPWAIIKVLTQMTINDCQTFGNLLEAVERISSIIAFYAEIETRLLIHVSSLTKQLALSITKLYGAVLQFLARTHIYYAQRTSKRILKSVFTTVKDVVDEPMLHIESLEDDVYKKTNIVFLDFHRFGNPMVASLVKIMEQKFTNTQASIDERRARLSARINGIHTQNTLEAAWDLHQPGTCEWVLQLDVFREWEMGDDVLPKLLWIHGPPGFGKTILSAWIIRHLQDNGDHHVSSFFCAADNERTRDPYAALRSWLEQILENDATIDVMERVLSERKGDDLLTPSKLWELFVAVGQVHPGCFFIMDGFDECTNIGLSAGYHNDEPRNIFLRELIHHLPEAQARVLIVSRNDRDIREYLSEHNTYECGFPRLEYQITSKDTAGDVRAFSASVVDETFPKKNEKIRQQIAREAAERSEGMFLWIHLLKKEISHGNTLKELREIVREMPLGIDQAYDRELEKFDSLPRRRRRQAIMVLRWVLFAVRPLKVKELVEALVVSDEESQSYPEDDLPDEWEECFVNEDYVKTKILGPGGSLLRLGSESPHLPLADRTVHLVHFSVKEYLASNGTESRAWAAKLSLTDPSTEMDALSRICLRYLVMDAFDEIPADTKLYPFLSYASWAWYFHSFHEKPPPCEDIMDSTKRAFDPASLSWRVWTPVLEQRLIDPGRTTLRPLLEEDSLSGGYGSDSGGGSDTRCANSDPLEDEESLTEVEAHAYGNHLENPIYYASMLVLNIME